MAVTKPNQAQADTDLVAVDELAKKIWAILSARRWWFVTALMLVMAGVVVATRHTPPIYRATGSLLIDLAAPKVLGDGSELVTLGSNTYYGARAYYQAQQQILQSRDVAAIVVNRLNLARSEHFFGLDDPSRKLTKEQKEAIMAESDPVAMLAPRVMVEVADESSIVKVSIEDSDPEFAKDLVNAILKAYRDRNIDQKKRAVKEASQDLQAIFGKLGKQKTESQGALYKFEKDNDFSENRSVGIKERLLALQRALMDVRSVKIKAGQEMNQLKRWRNSKDIFTASAPAVMRDGLVGELKRRFLELGSKRKELATTYLDQHPKIEAIDSQMEQLVVLAGKHVNAMYEAATQQYQASLAEEADLLSQIQNAKTEDDSIRQAKIEHDQLLQKAEEDKMFYEKVAKRLAEADITREIGVNNISILDFAITPKIPVRPNVRLNLLVGFLLALLVGTAVAVTVDVLDNTIKDRLDVEQNLKVPYLGAIPTFLPSNLTEGLPVPDGKLDLYTHFRPNSRAAEAVRAVRTNLLFMRPDAPLRSLLVASANPREGKTSTSAAIAVAMAASNGSCVLVDTDLRKPRLHKVFGVPGGEGGLTSYILSPGEPVTKFVRQTEVPGLDFMGCGPLPPNPAEILHTDRFKQMVRELIEHYDCVVFDSPPVDIVSDALVVAALVDGVVMVAHAEKSRREAVRSALQAFHAIKANVMGVVLSRTSIRGAGYGYYYSKGYRKGAPYRYRYAADPEKERLEDERLRREADARKRADAA